MLKFLKVTVPCYIPIAILGMVVGAVLASGTINDIRLLWAALSLTMVVGGFNTLNGVFDKSIDKLNKPKRPIASGSISARTGTAYAVFLYILAFVFAAFLNVYFILIVVISVVLTSLYSIPPIRLRARFLVNTLTGLIFYSMLCPLAGWALFQTMPVPWVLIVFLFILGTGIAITKDFEDVYGDSVHQIRTLPDTFGTDKTKKLISLLVIISFVYIAGVSLLGIIDVRYLGTLIFLPWGIYTIYALDSRNGNDKSFFIKNMLLVISLELFLIAVTLI